MAHSSHIFGSPPPRSSTARRRRRRALWGAACGAVFLASALAVRGGCAALQPPIAGAWVALGATALVGVAGFAWLKVERRWNLVALAGLLGALAGVTLYAFAAPPSAVVRVEPNRELAARVLRIDQALERYGGRPGRPAGAAVFPSNEEFLAFLQRLPEGAAWTRSPWDEGVQGSVVAPGGDTGLPTAAARVAGAALPALNTPLGPGRMPKASEGPGSASAGRFDARTYGALVYDRDPASGAYVLYGIGQLGAHAVVVAAAEGRP